MTQRETLRCEDLLYESIRIAEQSREELKL